jgi:hypothetical protein
VRDDPEVEVSVHAPVALGAFALPRVPKLPHLHLVWDRIPQTGIAAVGLVLEWGN